MNIIRSERYSALILLGAAVVGFIFANVAGHQLWEAVHGFLHETKWLGVITPYHVVSDLFLAIFFLGVAIELKHELVAGELNSFRKAIVPGVAALGGVVVPVLVFLAFSQGRPDLSLGWPVPTATDIAFALGILAIFGSKLPSQIRVFLLALAVLDDLVAILIIAVVFTSSVGVWWLLGALASVLLFGLASYGLARTEAKPARIAFVIWMVILAILCWYFTYKSGVHATIAGVAIGMLINRKQGARLEHGLEPAINGVILPLFALLAAMVPWPGVSISELSGAFWGILVALPVGKLVGISLFGYVAVKAFGGSLPKKMSFMNLVLIGALGGIGFTVSLLMNELAFAGNLLQDEGTVAVLLGSLISIGLSILLIRLRLGHYRRRRQALQTGRIGLQGK